MPKRSPLGEGMETASGRSMLISGTTLFAPDVVRNGIYVLEQRDVEILFVDYYAEDFFYSDYYLEETHGIYLVLFHKEIFVADIVRNQREEGLIPPEEKPIINDAILEDALAAGLDGCAEIVSSGCSAPGTVLDLCSPEFLKLFYNAPLIVSKGQGNYEGLSNVDREIFFMLVVKCPLVARDIDGEVGTLILKVKK